MPKSDELYETDFFCWTVQNAALLRQRKFDQIDLQHIAEEIEDMGGRDRREVGSRVGALLMHLLKWQFQPEPRGSSWRGTIIEQRREIARVFTQSPSVRRYAAENLEKFYREAVEDAADETRLPESAFPEHCPYTLEQALKRGFLPE